jgi:hypothetical protein
MLQLERGISEAFLVGAFVGLWFLSLHDVLHGS